MNRFTDPRPYLADSHLWTSLMREATQLPGPRAKELYFHLWGFRYYGVILHRTSATDIRLLPILYPKGAWLNASEFDEFKTMFLKPYSQEMKEIIHRLEA